MTDDSSNTQRGFESLPTTSLGNYKVRAKIGSGGMGDVYDAVHTGLNKRVAIKTLRKRFLDDEIVVARFLREGQLASRIRHPNIVDVTDVGMMGGLPCLVMEHLDGESFSALIRRDGRLPIESIVDILLPIIAAVDFAHDHGIVHRDLKPSNIFLARSWNGETVSKVLDFGISKLVHDAEKAALTTDSAFVGTPHYASPELMRADKLAGGRSDQYSMGVILYEASTGVRPFADFGNNFVALAMAICKGEYMPARLRNPAIPAAFDRVIERAMSLQAQDRFLTMRALGDALLPFASERAKVIWGPTFKGHSGAAPAAAEQRTSAPHSTTMAATVASKPPFSGATPVAAQSATPRFGVAALGSGSGSVPSVGSTPPAPSYPSHSASRPSSYPPSHPSHVSGPPAPLFHTPSAFPSSSPHPSQQPQQGNAFPSGTPPAAAFDRLPSYGAGTSAPPLAVRPRSSGMITAVIGVTVGLAILVSVIVLRSGHREDATSSKLASSTTIETTYAIDLSVTPSTAAIEMDGAAAGAGRLVRTFPRDGKKHNVRLSAPGYENLLVEFDDAHPPPSVIGLRPNAPNNNNASTSAAPTAGTASVGGHPRTSGPAAGGKVKGSSEGRPKTDNIDPWE